MPPAKPVATKDENTPQNNDLNGLVQVWKVFNNSGRPSIREFDNAQNAAGYLTAAQLGDGAYIAPAYVVNKSDEKKV